MVINCIHQGISKSTLGLPIYVQVYKNNTVKITLPNNTTPENKAKFMKFLQPYFYKLTEV